MSSIVELIRERVKETQRLLDGAKEETSRAQARQSSLEEQLEAYTATLRFEEQRNGASGPAPIFIPEIHAQADSQNADSVLINKADQLKRILRERKEGITPLDLHTELNKRGVEIGTNYVYGLLYKLRTGGEIRKRARKFYWVEPQETKPAS